MQLSVYILVLFTFIWVLRRKPDSSRSASTGGARKVETQSDVRGAKVGCLYLTPYGTPPLSKGNMLLCGIVL